MKESEGSVLFSDNAIIDAVWSGVVVFCGLFFFAAWFGIPLGLFHYYILTGEWINALAFVPLVFLTSWGIWNAIAFEVREERRARNSA
jgi:hypothetical protein